MGLVPELSGKVARVFPVGAVGHVGVVSLGFVLLGAWAQLLLLLLLLAVVVLRR